MQMRVEGMAGASLAANEIAALLDWWALAGADTPLLETPRPWLGPESGPGAAGPGAASAPASPAFRAADADTGEWASLPSLDALREAVLATTPGAPFADGNPASGLMLLGEAPSAEDLATGRPFSGPAGRFLDRMLASIGVDRGNCYIGLLCPRRRLAGTPSPEDIAADLPLALAHIRLAKPRHLLLLGAKPVQALSGNSTPISRIRGQWLAVDGIPALATFNPAYLLRRPEEKAHAWADLLALGQRLGR